MANFAGTNGNDTLSGSANDDLIDGLGGADDLTGHAGNDSISGGAGNDALVGGAGADTLNGGDGVDQVLYYRETGTLGVNANLGTGVVLDTFGNRDLLIGIEQFFGSSRADTILGSGAAGDLIFGREGNDNISGLGGNDTLIGDAGNDTLTGGAGMDQVAYFLETGTRGVTVDLLAGTATDTWGNTDVLSGIEQVLGTDRNDVILGDGVGDILFGRGGNDSLSGRGGDDTLVGDAGNDTLDGGAGGDQVAYFLETGTGGVNVDLRAGTATDTWGTTDTLINIQNVHGSAANDTLLGSDADGDRLFGGAGNDYMDGRDGNDLYYTGAGNDTISVGGTTSIARDTIVVNGSGYKTIIGFDSEGTEYGHHLVFEIDEAVNVNLATGFGRTATSTTDFSAALYVLEVGGTMHNDVLTGGNPRHDYLEWYVGNQGNDTINGGGGDADTVVYDDEVEIGSFNFTRGIHEFGTRGVVVNLVTGVATDTFGFTDTLIDIDDVRATKFADNLLGNAGVNAFWGLAGNDTLNGGAGSDRVHYGEDYLTGGIAGVTVNLATGVAIDGFGNTDRLISIEEVYATNQNDSVTGGAENNRLFGYAGNDTLIGDGGVDTLLGGDGADILRGGADNDELNGGNGADTLDGGAGIDLARYRDDTGGVIVDLLNSTAIDGTGGRDTLISIEGAHGSDHADRLAGDAGNNELSGFAGNDSLNGGLGNDTLLGGDGNDDLSGSVGDDELWGDAGNDTLNGNSGTDLARYRNDISGVTVNLAAGTATDGWGNTDSLIQIENVDGSDYGDTLTGDAGANQIFGYAGNDSLYGGAGDDTFRGGTENDRIYGGDGDDELWGGEHNDTLDGGAGNDLIRYRSSTSGVTVDLGTGQTSDDGLGGRDVLVSIEHAHGSDLGDSLTGSTVANRLFGFAGDDNISGGAGNDTMLGGDGNDSLYGGDDNDELWGEAGDDSIDGGAGSDLVRYRNAGAMTVNLTQGIATGEGSDRLTSIENVDGSDSADHITGSSAANILQGFAGADTLIGGAGDDVLSGREGGDRYEFSAGDGLDIINDLGDGTTDRVVFHDYVFADAAIYRQNPANEAIVINFGVTGDYLVLANSLNAGHVGAIEEIQWADGTVWGHATLIAQLDQTAVINRVADTTAGSDVRNLTPDADTVSGLGGNDVLRGLAGDDSLSGDDGNDTLIGGLGNDTLLGGAGADSLTGGEGDDVIDGGAGADTAVFDVALADAQVRYAGGVLTVTSAFGSDTVSNVESFRFADRVLTLAEMQAAGSNTAPVSSLPATLSNAEGAISVNFAPYFSDPESQALTWVFNGLPAGLSVTGASTVTGTIEATGQPIDLSITVTDIFGASVTDTVAWTIQNVNQAPTGGVSVEGIGVTGQVLTANTSALADADGLGTLSYQWFRGSAPLAGATGETYTVSADDTGQQVWVRVRYTDGFGTAEQVVSPRLDISLGALNLTGTAGNDSLEGGIGDDSLTGLAGNDTLVGHQGNDTLDGGDGTDILIGWEGDDFLYGGSSVDDLRDVIYGGNGNDSIEGGYGNDELRGDDGNDTVAGGFGADTVIGGNGDDVLTGSAYGDVIFGSDGNDFINGGFGFDRVNGGTGADKFFHLGVRDHGSDWIQDYNSAEGDVLQFGGPAATAASDFLIQRAFTPSAGAAGVQEVFITQISTGNLLWALVDGDAQAHINIQIGAQVFDLLA